MALNPKAPEFQPGQSISNIKDSRTTSMQHFAPEFPVEVWNPTIIEERLNPLTFREVSNLPIVGEFNKQPITEEVRNLQINEDVWNHTYLPPTISPQALPYVLPGCGPINIIKRIDEVEKYQRLIKEDLVWLNGEKNYAMCPLKQTGHMSIMQRLEDLERSSREYKDEYFKLREEKVSAGFNIMTGIGGHTMHFTTFLV